jgi:hypothetical protein
MSTDIEKIAVFDDRIVQSSPKYAVEKGALSLTNSPFQAIAANESQHTYQIQVPSEGVFVDRAIDWTSTCCLAFKVDIAGAFNANDPVVRFGQDCALASFPLHSLTQTLTATINDTTTTMNTNDVLREVMRLTDLKKNREQRTCTTYLDTYKNYDNGYQTGNTPLNSYANAYSADNVPNGAFPLVRFTGPNGAELVGNGTYTAGGINVNYVNGIPVGTVNGGSVTVANIPIFVSFTSTEKVILSPFVFSDIHENETGLFGCQNIQFVFNMNAPSFTGLNGRVLRTTTGGGRTLKELGYTQGVSTGGPFQGSVINVQFLTPSLDLSLPPKSIVPYMEFPRYVTKQTVTIAAGGVGNVSSQTITLPQIPDMLIIYVKPTTYAATDADWYYPITKANIQFDNYSGILASHTTEELYTMSYNNGLHMDYAQWLGTGKNADGLNTELTGGFLVLKPSKDIPLRTGQAPSLVGNFTLQIGLTIKNNTNVSTIQDLNVWVITCNSGFFETVRGSSRIIKGVLSESDIINATLGEINVRSDINRYVGGSFKSMLGNVMSKVQRVLPIVKMVAPLIKPMLPQPLQSAMSTVGLGATGAAITGAAETGAGMRRKSLSARLM